MNKQRNASTSVLTRAVLKLTTLSPKVQNRKQNSNWKGNYRGSVSKAMWRAWLIAVKRLTDLVPPLCGGLFSSLVVHVVVLVAVVIENPLVHLILVKPRLKLQFLFLGEFNPNLPIFLKRGSAIEVSICVWIMGSFFFFFFFLQAGRLRSWPPGKDCCYPMRWRR